LVLGLPSQRRCPLKAYRQGGSFRDPRKKTAGGLDFETMRRAIERLDADLLIDLYADDAQIRVVNKNTTPSSPFVLRGKERHSSYETARSSGR
jgi:hypothetical protein